MGRMIDKAIAKIWHCIVSIRDCVGNKEFVEALELSVDIMRKYQKIEDIYYHQTGRALEDSLRSVIEDGNVD